MRATCHSHLILYIFMCLKLSVLLSHFIRFVSLEPQLPAHTQPDNVVSFYQTVVLY
jgi:hypothetical protein